MRTIKFLLISLCIIAFSSNADAQRRKDRMQRYSSAYNYEIQCVGVGNDGTKSVKVWSYGRNVKKAMYKIKKDAVAAAIFRGIPAGGGAAKTPAIITDINAHETHADFFKKFFKAGGPYLQFVNLSDEAKPVGRNKIRMKGGYKIGMLVSINHDDLRTYLEDKGIARSLNSGF